MNQKIAGLLREHGAELKSFRAWGRSKKVVSGDMPTAKAVVLWQAIREKFTSTGVWPIIRGDAEDEDIASPFGPDPKKSLKNIPPGKIEELLAPRLAERIESFQKMIPNLSSDCDLSTFISKVDRSGVMSFSATPPRAAKWPIKPPTTELSIHTVESCRREGRASLRFSLVELAHPYQAPACLGFGGWNEAPRPDLQSAVLREWERVYGAVPMAMTRDVLECFVERPPQSEADSMRLAAQQWLFCDDIVGQGTQTVRNLAIEIWRSPRWFFWWD